MKYLAISAVWLVALGIVIFAAHNLPSWDGAAGIAFIFFGAMICYGALMATFEIMGRKPRT